MNLQTQAEAVSAGLSIPGAFDAKLWAAIQGYNLNIVTKTFAERHPKYGADAAYLERETKRFLYLAAAMPDTELAPTRPIDEYWHQMILFTDLYQDFGQEFVGEYIEHNPLAGPDHAKIFEDTQRHVRTHFGEEFEGIEFWTLPMPATSCRCTSPSKRRARNVPYFFSRDRNVN